MSKIYQDYFYDVNGFDTNDGGYQPLVRPKVDPRPLRIPELLKPDQETATDIYFAWRKDQNLGI